MSRNRADYVQSEIYDRHNGRKRMRPGVNQHNTRKAWLTRMYERVLSEMAMNRFTWEGLPDTVDHRFLEITLLQKALAVFYYDEEYGRFMALRASGSGITNMYDNPTEFRVYGNSMLNKTLKASECVPIWSNYWRTPDWDIIRIYSQRLAEADRTTEINMLNTRHPVVLAVDANERLTMENAFRNVQEGQPVIFGTENMQLGSITDKIYSFDLGGSNNNNLQDIMTAKVRIWNEALTLLGIMNVNSEKKERMVVEEASGSSGQVMAMRAVAMNSRQAACEQINRMYPEINVSVNWNLDENMTAGIPGMDDVMPVGGESDNGDIYD